MVVPVSGDGKEIRPGDVFWVLTDRDKGIYTQMTCTAIGANTVWSGGRSYAAQDVLKGVQSNIEGLLSEAVAAFQKRCTDPYQMEKDIYDIIERAAKSNTSAQCQECWDEGYAAGQASVLRWRETTEAGSSDTGPGMEWSDQIEAGSGD